MNEDKQLGEFAEAEIGQKLHLIGLGEVEVKRFSKNNIVVSDRKGNEGYVLLNGVFPGEDEQILFWSKPEIIAPPKPKKKVRKVHTRWVNVYKDNISPELYWSEPEAILNRLKAPRSYGEWIKAVPVTIEYEVEE